MGSFDVASELSKERKTERYIVFCISAVTILLRIYNISAGNYVVWDEAHFGKFGRNYIKNTFYTDLHPPLAKMTVGLVNTIFGDKGDVSYSSAATYPDFFNYGASRLVLSMFGSLAVVFVYITCRKLGFSRISSVFAALILMVENGLITVSRFILLDSQLLFYTMLVSIFFAHYVFKKQSYTYLALLGVSIGMVDSVKWVGFLTTAHVGLYVAYELTTLTLKTNFNVKVVLRRFLERALFLIGLPLAVYVLFFFVHFRLLTKSGSGDAAMPPHFQIKLKDNKIKDSALYVTVNSTVNIRNCVYAAGLLHSHVQRYPGGTMQQQVTLYNYNDDNNNWRIEKEKRESVHVKSKDVVYLKHVLTNKLLRTELLNQDKYEVCGSLDPNITKKDKWIVEVEEDYFGDEYVKCISTKFRLKNKNFGCYLSTTKKKLPTWGFSQGEVSCTNSRNNASLWIVESNVDTLQPQFNMKLFSSTFIEDLFSVNMDMARSNSSLKHDKDKEISELISMPWQWPLFLKGLRITPWDDEKVKFGIIHNPFCLYLTTLSVFVTFVLYLICLVFSYRGSCACRSFLNRYQRHIYFTLGGWILHYIPFYLQKRVLYAHHYFPALFYAAMCTGALLEFCLEYTNKNTIALFAILTSIVATVTFKLYSPVCYGIYGSSLKLMRLQLYKGWNIAGSGLNKS